VQKVKEQFNVDGVQLCVDWHFLNIIGKLLLFTVAEKALSVC
jgi:hypothetical protein